MYIEDLIILLNNLRKQSSGSNNLLIQNSGLIVSLSNYCENKIGFTSKQRELTIKILKKNQKLLTNTLKQDVSKFINNPEFKLPIQEMIKFKTARLKNINDQWVIEIKFPYNGSILNLIHRHRLYYFNCNRRLSVKFNYDDKAWHMELNEVNLAFTNQLLQHDFILSEELLSLNKKVNEILFNSKEYIPYIGYDQGYYLKNIVQSTPQLNTNNLQEMLLHARKCGIFDWDDLVQEHIRNDSTLRILENYFQGSTNDIFMISDLVPFLRMCNKFLVVLPTSVNVNHIIKIHEYLKECNIDSTEISTLVRTNNKHKLEFNSYIKDNKLNNKISNQTRVTIVSRTNPKIFNDTEFDIILCVSQDNRYSHIYKRLKHYIEQSDNFIWVNI